MPAVTFDGFVDAGTIWLTSYFAPPVQISLLAPLPYRIEAAAQAVGAFAMDRDSLEAAILVTLVPGDQKVEIYSEDEGEGVVLVEVYLLPESE